MRTTFVLFIIFLSSLTITFGQDCRENLRSYLSRIDTTERPVYFVVDEMPEFFESAQFMIFLQTHKELYDSIKCCPMYVNIGLVLEADSTLSNIEVYTSMRLCDEQLAEKEAEKFDKRLLEILKSIKVAPGKLDGKEVSILYTFPIHFE